jgi:hypothetical protein
LIITYLSRFLYKTGGRTEGKGLPNISKIRCNFT